MSVFKRGKKWYYRFKIRGKQYYKVCPEAIDQRTALQYETIVKSELMKGNLGIIEETKRATLKEAIDLYLNYSKNNKKSYLNDIAYTREFLKFFKANTCLLDILPSYIEDFKRHLAALGKKKATINRYLQALSKLFNVAIDNKKMPKGSNPVSSIKKLKVENTKIRFLTKLEERILFKNLPKFYFSDISDPDKESSHCNVYLKLIIKLALKTGARKSEILNLSWENIDFGFRYIELLHTKSGKKRKIPLSKFLYRVLSKLKKINNSDYVFPNRETGKPFVDIKRAFNTALKRAGIKDFRFHDLRHTFATRLIEKGVDIVVVKELLGHADIKTTMIYVHSDAERKQNAINLIDSY